MIDPCCLMNRQAAGAHFVRSFLFGKVADAFDCLPTRVYRLMLLNKSFRLCNDEYCPILVDAPPAVGGIDVQQAKARMATQPSVLIVDADNFCNLTCPSCRTRNDMNRRIKNTADAVASHMAGLDLAKIDEISCALYGEMLASRSNIELIRSLELKRHSHVTFTLRTNGTLVRTPQFEDLLAYVGTLDVVVSVDGATKTTFEKLRRGASFDAVMKNLVRLGDYRGSGRIRQLQFTMVVQEDNFREIPDVVELAATIGADVVRCDRYQMQTQGPEEYKRSDVYLEHHPSHAEFIGVYGRLCAKNVVRPTVVWNPDPAQA